jgi:hypothetical protein
MMLFPESKAPHMRVHRGWGAFCTCARGERHGTGLLHSRIRAVAAGLLQEKGLKTSWSAPGAPHPGNPPKTANVGRINPPKMLGLSLVFIPRLLDFIGTHRTSLGGEMQRDHLDADIERIRRSGIGSMFPVGVHPPCWHSKHSVRSCELLAFAH